MLVLKCSVKFKYNIFLLFQNGNVPQKKSTAGRKRKFPSSAEELINTGVCIPFHFLEQRFSITVSQHIGML